jgi:uncharacterized membrane protein YdcZ (DUF606 family)
MTAKAQGTGPRLETNVNWRVWLGGVVALVLAGSLCLVSPRMGGAALILLALAAVAAFAYRLL